ncbi:MAG: glycosyltransferase, partial [Bacteroidota bacterium]|nr:glycosyltransferase [Bacteroidota bacterium]
NINYHFAGYLDQKTLPSYYANSKLLLFPTVGDCWGIVANEACAAGTPVITCDYAGVADDLIINGKNGYVLTLNAEHWAKHALYLLMNPEILKTFSANAVELVQPFNHQQSADGIFESVRFSLS